MAESPGGCAEGAPQSTRLLAVRHGETAWNAAGRIQGQLDIGLNETGLWQAGQLAAALCEEPIDAIYSSDLARARQTAEPLARQIGLPLRLDPGLRERAFGAFQGLTFDEIAIRWPDASRAWRQRDPDFAPPGGESLRVFLARAVGTVERLAALHPGQTIAVVSHGGVMDCLYRAATRVDLQAARSWLLGNASINRLLYTAQGLSLIGWSDTLHLERAPLDESGARVTPAAQPDSVGHAA